MGIFLKIVKWLFVLLGIFFSRVRCVYSSRSSVMNVASIKAKIKGIDYRHYVALGITILFALFGAFV